MYLRRPGVRSLWVLAPEEDAVCTMAIAAVEKSSGDALRKINMSVPFNTVACTVDELMGYPVDYGLVGGTALCQCMACDDSLDVAAMDESNAFTYIETPRRWWPMMAGPRIRAGDLPRSWTRGRWAASRWLRPQYRRLGMGHTHSGFILMQINLGAIERSLSGAKLAMRVVLLSLAPERARRCCLVPGTVAIYLHLDDFGFLGMRSGDTDQVRAVVRDELERMGFKVTCSRPMDGRFIGYAPRRSPARWDPCDAKLGGIDRMFELMLERPWVAVDDLHTLLCIYTWMGLLWRPSLAIPHHIYSLTRHYAGEAVRWWPSVRNEVHMMRGFLLFVYADVGARVAPVVLAQDAAGGAEESVRQRGHLRYGAWSLALAVPPRDEVVSVVYGIETIGRARALPLLSAHCLSEAVASAAADAHVQSDVVDDSLGPLVARSLLPESWFSSAVP